MKRDDVSKFLTDYKNSFSAPVRENTQVINVRFDGTLFRAITSTGNVVARTVVLATGACDTPRVPVFAQNISHDIEQITPDKYKDPDWIADGGVLIVGASATGIQLANELQSTGRKVSLAVGSHIRVPRRYRGRDIMQWLDLCGFLSEGHPPNADLFKLARQPSLQLVGSAQGHDLDLQKVLANGVRLVGRVADAQGDRVALDANLTDDIARAEERRLRLLARIDQFITSRQLVVEEDPHSWVSPNVPVSCPPQLDLRQKGIKTIVWATGYRRDYSWLDVPNITQGGEIKQMCGVSECPGLFTLGLPYMMRRNSTFIDGVGADAMQLAENITAHLENQIAFAA